VQRVLFADAELTPIDSVDALLDAVLHAVEVVDSPDEIDVNSLPTATPFSRPIATPWG
jgi:hypothetical protein